MRPAISNQPPEQLLLGIVLAIWFLIETRQALNRRAEATNTDRGSFLVVRVSAAAGILLALLALKATQAAFPLNVEVAAVALALMSLGVGLRWWCFRTLGRYFTFQVMTSSDQPVIRTGPYRALRHPSYAAILLILVGIGLTYGNWLSLGAITLVPLLGFLNRIRVEEAALSKSLGPAYVAYASTRKRLIPFVW